MKTSIGLRAYAQKNPLYEYKKEAFILFEIMLAKLRENVTKVLGFSEFRIQPRENLEPVEEHMPEKEDIPPAKMTNPISGDIPRNAPCPCGSGKKYKHCCGKLD